MNVTMPKLFSPNGLKAGDCPLFTDLGKQAKDLFEKGFYLGVVNLKMKAQMNDYLEITSSHDVKIEDKKVASKLESKFEYNHFTFIPIVALDNKFTGEVKWANVYYDWAKLKANGAYDLNNRQCNGILGVVGQFKDFSIECLANCDKFMTDFGLKTNVVAKVYGCVIGTSLVADYKEKTINSKLLCGYQNDQYSVFMDFNPKQKQIGGTAFHSLCDNFQVGVAYSKDGTNGVAGLNATSIFGPSAKENSVALCANYELKNGTSLKTRVNNKSIIALACKLDLKKDLKVTMCCELNLQDIRKEGVHQIGFGLEF